MCGRYAISHSADDLQSLFDVGNPEALPQTPRYNIAPTQLVGVVFRNRSGERTAGQARWGLVPHWVEHPGKWRAATFNARSEEAASKPTFRQAFRRGRVLVPASGFYEWKRAGSRKVPFHIRDREGDPLAFAGLMDVWRAREGEERLVSVAILTSEARGPLIELHDRMPVLVRPERFDAWLGDDPPQEALERIVSEAPVERLESYEVTAAVNSARADDPSFVAPLAEG